KRTWRPAVPSSVKAAMCCGLYARSTAPTASAVCACRCTAAASCALDIISNRKLDQKVVEFLHCQDYSLVENLIYRSTFLLKAYKMIFAYNQIKARPKLLLAMTGLTQDEFDQLLLHFQHAWDQFVRQNYVDRANRQRQYGGGRSEET